MSNVYEKVCMLVDITVIIARFKCSCYF